jgi:hypothetical protein
VACATSYEVDVDGVIFPVADSPITYSSTPGVHTWRVRALNPAGPGPWSPPFSFNDLGAPPPLPSGSLIVGNDQAGTATIYSIDVNTGVATAIYSTSNASQKPWGMAFDAPTNTLYWTNGSTLNSSNFANPLVPTTLGPITFNGVNTTFVGLSFANGKLYGTRNIATEAVYEIDPATRIATPIYVHPSTFDFNGLEHDATTGLLYGITNLPSASRGLYEFDLVGQTQTFLAPYPSGETDLDALAVGSGYAYLVSDGPNAAQAIFYVVDLNSGAVVGALPSPFTGVGTFSGATFVPAGGGAPFTYCTAGTSTNGCVPAISANVQPNVANNAGCVVSTANLEGQRMGLVFYGLNNNAFVPVPWGASSSLLCVKPPIQRTFASNLGGTVNACDGALSFNWDAWQLATPTALGNPWSAGDRVYVQCWYRDPPSPEKTNLSDAIQLTMQP